jgi:hypothetical protein
VSGIEDLLMNPLLVAVRQAVEPVGRPIGQAQAL